MLALALALCLELTRRPEVLPPPRLPPELGELVRLPSVEKAREAVRVVDAFAYSLDQLEPFVLPQERHTLEPARKDAGRLRDLWQLVLKAHGEDLEEEGNESYVGPGCWTDDERREALAELRAALGDAAFYAERVELATWPWWRVPRTEARTLRGCCGR